MDVTQPRAFDQPQTGLVACGRGSAISSGHPGVPEPAVALAVQCRRDSLGIWPQEGRGPLPPPWWVAHWAGLVSSREVG